jgi:hypothetical protein
MKPFKNNHLVVILLLLSIFNPAYAQATTIKDPAKISNPPQIAPLDASAISNVKKLAFTLDKSSFYGKILGFSQAFIGKPYNFELGDRLITWDQKRDKNELIDLTSFDCISYVETVLALATLKDIASDDNQFAAQLGGNIAKIMFSSTDYNFVNRNHFIDTEWLKHNAGIIGHNVVEKLAYAKTKTAKINKAALLETQISDYAEKYLPSDERAEFAAKYYQQLKDISPVDSTISYISFADFLKHQESLSKKLKNNIYLFLMIMDNPKMLELTKSEHNVAHVGFVFAKDGKLYLRHATSAGPKTVIEVPLEDVAKGKEQSKIFPGIALFKIKKMAK